MLNKRTFDLEQNSIKKNMKKFKEKTKLNDEDNQDKRSLDGENDEN